MKKLLSGLLISAVLLSASVSTIFAGEFTNDSTTNSNFDRTLAYNYMVNWAEEPKGNEAQYVYFGGVGGDCTNFVSQVLKAGGMAFKNNNGTQYNGNTNAWYYTNSAVRSTSWTGAHEFRYHWANVNDVGYNRAYKYEVYTKQQFLDNFKSIYDKIWKGDVVQHVNGSNGDTTHSMVVSGYTGGKIQVAQHSVGSANNFLSRDLKTFVEGKSSSDFIVISYIKSGS